MASSTIIDRVQQLIGPAGRVPAALAAVVGAATAVILAVLVWGRTTTDFDLWWIVRAYRDFGGYDSPARRGWLVFSNDVVSTVVPSLVTVVALCRRRWPVAAFAALGPLLALVVTEWIGKPLVGRYLGPQVVFGSLTGAVRGSFPSGHETGTVAWLTVLLVLVLRAAPGVRVRVAAVLTAVLWALAGALGLTVNYYHYATDTIGAVGVGVSAVLAVGFAVDAVTVRVRAARG